MSKPQVAGEARQECLKYGVAQAELLEKTAKQVARRRSAHSVSVQHVKIAKSQIDIMPAQRWRRVIAAFVGMVLAGSSDRLFDAAEVGEPLTTWGVAYGLVAAGALSYLAWDTGRN